MIITKLNERCEFERELGRGAFGVGYLARDTHLCSRCVAVKILLHLPRATNPIFESC